MINGLSEKEAIEAAVYNKKKTKAMDKIAKDYSLKMVSDKVVNEYLTHVGSVINEKDLEILLLTSGFDTFEDYKNSPITISATKYMFMYGEFNQKIINEEKEKEKKSKLSDEKVTEAGMKKSKDILNEYIMKEE